MPAIQPMERWRQDSRLPTQTQDQSGLHSKTPLQKERSKFIWEETEKAKWKGTR